MPPNRRRRRERGLTLLEMMIVIAIIALVMGVFVVPALMGQNERAQRNLAELAVKKLAYEAYPQWALANPTQRCPADLAALAAELGNSTVDPWGSPYRLICGAGAPPEVKTIGVVSLGPDRTDNTSDDIRSW